MSSICENCAGSNGITIISPANTITEIHRKIFGIQAQKIVGARGKFPPKVSPENLSKFAPVNMVSKNYG